jgi:phosphatidylserine/phosphatidylglycerophosphate/cardiolipin synthase-like enzyme
MNFIEGAIGAISSLVIGEQGTKGEWDKTNRYMSFAHGRKNCHVKWYVDAKDYFYAVSEALMSAKEEILIEDLWLSPELVRSISVTMINYHKRLIKNFLAQCT